MLKNCSNPECNKPSKVLRKGLCNTCSQRLRRNGSLEYRDPTSMIGRAPRPGERHLDHPLYFSWQRLRTHLKNGRVCDEWSDFETFVKEIGNKPSERHFLSRLDDSKPWGPDNFYWREPMFEKRTFRTADDRREYHQKYKEYRHGYDRERCYITKYGLTLTQYKEMAKVQDNRCAICGLHESQAQQGTVRQLAVDHDHTTNAVRKLLDNKCNAILGHSGDSTELLIKCVVYLDKHSETPGRLIEAAIKQLQEALGK